MKVSLIGYTGKGSPDPARLAANLLVFTKMTRLTMNEDTIALVEAMSHDEIMNELEYMANTVPSSWEFIDYTFLIQGVTRAFTHQLVRTRTGSYAQQAMRVVDMAEGRGWDYETGPSISGPNRATYDDAMAKIDTAYRSLIANGAKTEDARGVLPTNIHTNIVAKFNLRSMAETFRKRSSSRVQGEYRAVVFAMRKEILRVHPWAKLFLDRSFDKVALELGDAIAKLDDPATRDRLTKLLDQMRASV